MSNGYLDDRVNDIDRDTSSDVGVSYDYADREMVDDIRIDNGISNNEKLSDLDSIKENFKNSHPNRSIGTLEALRKFSRSFSMFKNYLLGVFVSNYPGLIVWFCINVDFLAKPIFSTWKDNDGNSLIHYGASKHDMRLVKAAIGLGCSYGILNKDGKNELHLFFENLIYEKKVVRSLKGLFVFKFLSVLKFSFDFIYGANFNRDNIRLLNRIKDKDRVLEVKGNESNDVILDESIKGSRDNKVLNEGKNVRAIIHGWLADYVNEDITYGFSCNEDLMKYMVDELGMDICGEYGVGEEMGEGWKKIDLAGFSIRNILGTSLEIVMLNYWLFLRECGIGYSKVGKIEDENYSRVVKFLMERGAKINEINRSQEYVDSVRDAMQESVIRVLCPYFIRFLKHPMQILVFRDILKNKDLDVSIPQADGNTLLHFLLFKFSKEGSGLMLNGSEHEFIFNSGLLDLDIGRLRDFCNLNLSKFIDECEEQLVDRKVLKCSEYNNMIEELVSDAMDRINDYEIDVIEMIGENDGLIKNESINEKKDSYIDLIEDQRNRCHKELIRYKSVYGYASRGSSKYWINDDADIFRVKMLSSLEGFIKNQEIFLNKEILRELGVVSDMEGLAGLVADANTADMGILNRFGFELLGISSVVVDLYNAILDLRKFAEDEIKAGEDFVRESMDEHIEFFSKVDFRVLESILLLLIEGGNLSLDDFFIENKNGDKPIDYLGKNNFLTRSCLLDWVKKSILDYEIRERLNNKVSDVGIGSNKSLSIDKEIVNGNFTKKKLKI